MLVTKLSYVGIIHQDKLDVPKFILSSFSSWKRATEVKRENWGSPIVFFHYIVFALWLVA